MDTRSCFEGEHRGKRERIPCAASPALLLHSAFSHISAGAKQSSESLREPKEQDGMGKMHQDPAWHQNAAPNVEYRKRGRPPQWCDSHVIFVLNTQNADYCNQLGITPVPNAFFNLGICSRALERCTSACDDDAFAALEPEGKENPIFWLLLITSPHFKEIFICLAWKISQTVFIRGSFVCQQWILLYYWKESKAKVPACTVNLSKQKMFLKKLRHYFYNKPQPNSKPNK